MSTNDELSRLYWLALLTNGSWFAFPKVVPVLGFSTSQILFLGAGNQDGSGSPQTKTMKDYEYVSDY